MPECIEHNEETEAIVAKYLSNIDKENALEILKNEIDMAILKGIHSAYSRALSFLNKEVI